MRSWRSAASWCSPRAAVEQPSSSRSGLATATHYEILGVDPDASHDVVKRAYTNQAMRWHPDRRGDVGPDAQASAEWHMQELNAAWSVLRSPADRAAYDDELLGRSARRGPARVVESAGPSFADQLVEPVRDDAAPPRPPSGRRWSRLAPLLIVVLLVIVGLAVAASVSSSRRSTPIDQPELRTSRYEVGSCVLVQPGPVVTGVACELPNSGRVAATTDYPRPCPAGTETVSIVAEQLSVCLAVP